MIFWGIGTLFAGTSYQAFGYQLKCVNKEFTNFTDWWEIIYMMCMAISFGFLIVAISYGNAKGKTRMVLQKLVYVVVPLYVFLLTLGSIIPIQILVTYEVLNVFFMPYFVVFFILSVKGYQKRKDQGNRRLIITWLLFLFVNVSYYIYYYLGISEKILDMTGIWFNQNDALHVLIFLWMGYIWFALPNSIEDITEKL
jgi:hypothetical protein